MRELNACKAEVFRRSEEMIQKRRRKRRWVLTGCVSLCVCVAAWSVAVLPGMRAASQAPVTNGSGNAIIGNVMENAAMGGISYVQVRIQTAEDGKTVTDQAQTANIFGAIQALYGDADSTDGRTEATDENYQAPAAGAVHTITFTAPDGSRAVYQLTGCELVNAGTGEAVYLTQDQLERLLAVLDQNQ